MRIDKKTKKANNYNQANVSSEDHKKKINTDKDKKLEQPNSSSK